MKVAEKIPYAERAISSITRHHDAPYEERVNAMQHLAKFIERELASAKKEAVARKAKEVADAKIASAKVKSKAHAVEETADEPRRKATKRTKH